MASGVPAPALGRPSRHWWTAVVAGLSLFAAVAAAWDRPAIFDLTPPSYR